MSRMTHKLSLNLNSLRVPNRKLSKDLINSSPDSESISVPIQGPIFVRRKLDAKTERELGAACRALAKKHQTDNAGVFFPPHDDTSKSDNKLATTTVAAPAAIEFLPESNPSTVASGSHDSQRVRATAHNAAVGVGIGSGALSSHPPDAPGSSFTTSSSPNLKSSSCDTKSTSSSSSLEDTSTNAVNGISGIPIRSGDVGVTGSQQLGPSLTLGSITMGQHGSIPSPSVRTSSCAFSTSRKLTRSTSALIAPNCPRPSLSSTNLPAKSTTTSTAATAGLSEVKTILPQQVVSGVKSRNEVSEGVTGVSTGAGVGASESFVASRLSSSLSRPVQLLSRATSHASTRRDAAPGMRWRTWSLRRRRSSSTQMYTGGNSLNNANNVGHTAQRTTIDLNRALPPLPRTDTYRSTEQTLINSSVNCGSNNNGNGNGTRTGGSAGEGFRKVSRLGSFFGTSLQQSTQANSGIKGHLKGVCPNNEGTIGSTVDSANTLRPGSDNSRREVTIGSRSSTSSCFGSSSPQTFGVKSVPMIMRPSQFSSQTTKTSEAHTSSKASQDHPGTSSVSAMESNLKAGQTGVPVNESFRPRSSQAGSPCSPCSSSSSSPFPVRHFPPHPVVGSINNNKNLHQTYTTTKSIASGLKSSSNANPVKTASHSARFKRLFALGRWSPLRGSGGGDGAREKVVTHMTNPNCGVSIS